MNVLRKIETIAFYCFAAVATVVFVAGIFLAGIILAVAYHTVEIIMFLVDLLASVFCGDK